VIDLQCRASNFAGHDNEDSRRHNLSHPVAAMIMLIKDHCAAHINQLPPMARLPACTLRSVFVANATIFRDVNGDVRNE
jgi:hypothetical protein